MAVMSHSRDYRFGNGPSALTAARHCFLLAFCLLVLGTHPAVAQQAGTPRERISLNADWRFQKGDPAGVDGRLAYDKIKDWVTATGNEFVLSSATEKRRPAGNLGE